MIQFGTDFLTYKYFFVRMVYWQNSATKKSDKIAMGLKPIANYARRLNTHFLKKMFHYN